MPQVKYADLNRNVDYVLIDKKIVAVTSLNGCENMIRQEKNAICFGTLFTVNVIQAIRKERPKALQEAFPRLTKIMDPIERVVDNVMERARTDCLSILTDCKCEATLNQ